MVRPPEKLVRRRIFKRCIDKNQQTMPPRHSCRSRTLDQSCGRIRADAAERRSSANNIIADLGQKCNPKNQHGRKTRAAGYTSPKTAVIGKPRRTAVQHAAAGDGRRFASRCGRWYNTMQTLYFLPRSRTVCAGCGGAGICCAGDPDRKEPFHDPHCHCRG